MLRLVCYALTPILAIGLRKYEIPLTFVLVCILAAVFYRRTGRQMGLAALIGIAMASLEYICIHYGMWKYFRVQNTIPIWLPLLWTIVAVFIIDVFARFA